MASLLLPLRSHQVSPPKGKPQSAASWVIRESVKWRAKDAEMVDHLHEAAVEMLKAQQQLPCVGVLGGRVRWKERGACLLACVFARVFLYVYVCLFLRS